MNNGVFTVAIDFTKSGEKRVSETIVKKFEIVTEDQSPESKLSEEVVKYCLENLEPGIIDWNYEGYVTYSDGFSYYVGQEEVGYGDDVTTVTKRVYTDNSDKIDAELEDCRL